VWDVAFAHNFNDWEVKVVVAVLNLLDSHVLSREGVDSWRWRMKRNGVFDIRSFSLGGVFGRQSPSKGRFFSLDHGLG
jgi:hypothetical protein